MRSILPAALAATCLAGCASDGLLLSDRDAGGSMPGVTTTSFVACEREGERWYAEGGVALNVATVRGVRAVLCDLEGTGPEAAGGLPCAITSEVAFSDATARVACGVGDPAAGGYRYATVRFVVEP